MKICSVYCGLDPSEGIVAASIHRSRNLAPDGGFENLSYKPAKVVRKDGQSSPGQTGSALKSKQAHCDQITARKNGPAPIGQVPVTALPYRRHRRRCAVAVRQPSACSIAARLCDSTAPMWRRRTSGEHIAKPIGPIMENQSEAKKASPILQ